MTGTDRAGREGVKKEAEPSHPNSQPPTHPPRKPPAHPHLPARAPTHPSTPAHPPTWHILERLLLRSHRRLELQTQRAAAAIGRFSEPGRAGKQQG
jgi:hypothetical protein